MNNATTREKTTTTFFYIVHAKTSTPVIVNSSMWQLQLLRDVIPAFEVLARQHLRECDIDGQRERKQDLTSCYTDMMSIRKAMQSSRGEWTPQLDMAEVTKLLGALESRFRSRSRLETFLLLGASSRRERSISRRKAPSSAPRPVPIVARTPAADHAGNLFPTLCKFQELVQVIAYEVDLERQAKTSGMDSHDSDGEAVETPAEETLRRCLDQMASSIRLFRREKSPEGPRDRKIFLKILRTVSSHLTSVYLEPPEANETRVDLASHPSNGVKKLADSVYDLLGRHWRCHCHWRASAGAREARLSLTRHHEFLLKVAVPQRETGIQTNGIRNVSVNAEFEVLLPVCRDCVTWKVTDVHVMAYICGSAATRPKLLVREVCELLLESDAVRLSLLAEHDKALLWVVHPPAPQEATEHVDMDSLHQLLGDGHAAPSAACLLRYNDKEKLTLAFILATSVLYLYPGVWLQTTSCWSSDKIFFPRRANGLHDGRPVTLTRPYLSMDLLQRPGNTDPSPSDICRYHFHPAVLALGIMLLEIATSTRFKVLCERSNIGGGPKQDPRAATACSNLNVDGGRALQVLDQLERHHPGRYSSSLFEAIRACLVLKPPADLPYHSLIEDGPLRFYVLSRVVAPLGAALEKGYRIPLDRLTEEEEPRKGLNGDRFSLGANNLPERREERPVSPREHTPDQGGLYLHGGAEDVVDRTKMSATKTWFEFYNNMLIRVYHDNRSIYCRSQPSEKVAIAILDSGIELSEDQQDKYIRGRQVVYQSWVDDERSGDGPGASQDWKDSVGHGTHLATVLARLAPTAAIYVARVFQRSKPDLKTETKNVARAIWHAVGEWKVDIIIMPFGFADAHDAANPRDSILQAIRHATTQGIAMFAAASNDGKNRPDEVAWPARASEVICVHSFDGSGNPSTFTPGASKDQTLAALGEAVESAWPEQLRSPHPGYRYMSGTSCAAAIAGSIAAVVLDYARAFLSEEDWRELRRVGGIRRIFDKMTHSRTFGYSYIRPWQIFAKERADSWIQEEIKMALGTVVRSD